MTATPSLPALREAVTTMGTCRCYGVEGCDACADNMYVILNALPALLDEVEAARAELDLLHTQIDYIKTMQDHKDMNPGDELIALRQSEKHAWDEAAQARIDGAENLMLLTQELQVELAAARAVLETAEYIIVAHRGPVRMIDATAWQAWQERRK